ncbi:helicase [Arthrobacter sp. Leaf337]|uniref:helicase-related protein n=1 Tax=Arthrobacter sp. Leaf337 TaxID=1736342 RepID=UPI0006FE7B20|nr:helicase-related protein [Arthrobacter sp. Leaf337]KQR80299.1 helicase [Arthrobacter sp. Leaf337]
MSTETEQLRYAVGSLVRARGREWVVLPDSDKELLVLRPLGGRNEEIAGVLPGIEQVEPASFGWPSADDLGDDRSARLLRDALRIGFRSSGGPFRCLASLGVSPRPYQLVPLLLALRQETVRLLIADDVGIGKTIEAGLVAAELLAQGSAERLAVLCPPSLAEQWRSELQEKFGIEAELVLPGTIRRLERGLEYGQSVFERHKFTIVSTDFIKSESRRHEFLRSAPDLVIVDEAHGVAADDAGRGGSGRTQRYRLVRELAGDAARHLILVTATPHSGNDGAFRNLIGLLDKRLIHADLSTVVGRRLLADYMVQRRRADIRRYLNSDTKFPKDRQISEEPYKLAPEHRAFFDSVLAYVRGRVQDKSGTKLEQRIRWWSALSLLRSMASSPAAAAATLSTRSVSDQSETDQAADARGAAEVLDQVEDDGTEGIDQAPGALHGELDVRQKEKSLINGFRKTAETLAASPENDAKLQLLAKKLKKLIDDGFDPIVFCRFIPTAHYVKDYLREKFKKFEVEVVTGELPSEERAARIASLADRAEGTHKILIATDCLSEGVNLQDKFQAVVHYDLAWNPTRHEQREGRVDRFGQPAEVVRALLIYGEDNGIDGIVLDVLLRKHDRIRRDLGISVPVPPQSDQVLAALLEGLLMRGHDADQLELDLGLETAATALEEEWRSSAEHEKESRGRFAQAAIHPDDVEKAVAAARRSLGDPQDVASFVRTALEESGAQVYGEQDGFEARLISIPAALRQAISGGAAVKKFVVDYPAPRHSAVLLRSDRSVSGAANYVLNSALDSGLPDSERPARRAGLIATNDVDSLTTALLVRFRTKLVLPARLGDRTDMAEEARVIAFTGPPSNPTWLDEEAVEALLEAKPVGNTPVETARNMLSNVLNALGGLSPLLDAKAREVADEVRRAHVEVRLAARGDRAGQLGVRGLTVEPNLPVDILGVYVYRPANIGGGLK